MDRLRKTALHEASHAVVAHLFQEYLDLQQVTISRKALAEGQTNSGKFDIANSGELKRFDPEAYMAYSITNLAGMVGQTIAAEGAEKIKERKEEILTNPSIIDKEFGSEDMQSFINTCSVNNYKYKMNDFEYQKFCISFLIDLLTLPEVWMAVEQFADTIIEKEDEQLDKMALTAFFKNCGYDDFLKSSADEFIARIHYDESEIEQSEK